MSQLAQEKQVNLRTSARLNALSQYVLQIYFSVDDKNPRKFMCCGSVNGTPVSTIYRDTGCSSVIIFDSILPDAITTNVPNVDVYDYLG